MSDIVRDELGAPKTVDRSVFEAELDALRIREKAHTREGDAIAAARRRLPMVEVDGLTPLIGVLTGFAGEVPTAAIMVGNVRISGITVGSREQQLAMIRAIEANGIRPVIDSSYPLEGLADAFRHEESRRHFGKICVEW